MFKKGKFKYLFFTLTVVLFLSVPSFAAEPIKIALIQAKSGILEQFGNQASIGFMLGLEYATGGTMKLLGRPIEVIQRDDQGSPAMSKQLLVAAYKDDKVDIAVGSTNSASGMAMLDIPKEFKKILIVDPAVSDEITGPTGNRYVFKTSRNSSHDAQSSAAAIAGPNVYIATVAQDYTFGHAFVDALEKAAVARGAKIVHKVFLPAATQDFTAAALKIADALKDKPGKRYLYCYWAGKGAPLNKFKEMQIDTKYNINFSMLVNVLPGLKLLQAFEGMDSGTSYYYKLPKNKINDWFVSEHKKRYKNEQPDFFTCGGFAAAQALVAGVNKAKSIDTEKLIAAMEGMHWNTPKGEMFFRKSDHQALQSMYVVKLKNEPGVDHIVPQLVKELTFKDMDIPAGR